MTTMLRQMTTRGTPYLFLLPGLVILGALLSVPKGDVEAADAYGFGDREIALACASHSGEPEHAKLAA